MDQKQLVVSGTGVKSVAVKVGAGIGGLALLAFSANLVMSAVTAGLGLIALGGLATVSFVFYKFMPYFVQKLDNQVLASQKQDARDNAVEQFENGILAMVQEANHSAENIKKEHSNIKEFVQKIEGLRKKSPQLNFADKDAKIQLAKRALEKNINEYNAKVAKIQQLRQDLDNFKAELELAEADLQISGQQTHTAETEKRQMLMDEARSSLQSRISRGFSGMEIDASGVLADLSDPSKSVEYQPTEEQKNALGMLTLDLSFIDKQNEEKSGGL